MRQGYAWGIFVKKLSWRRRGDPSWILHGRTQITCWVPRHGDLICVRYAPGRGSKLKCASSEPNNWYFLICARVCGDMRQGYASTEFKKMDMRQAMRRYAQLCAAVKNEVICVSLCVGRLVCTRHHFFMFWYASRYAPCNSPAKNNKFFLLVTALNHIDTTGFWHGAIYIYIYMYPEDVCSKK